MQQSNWYRSNLFPILGLISSSVIILTYIVTYILYNFNYPTNGSLFVFTLLSTVSFVLVFLSFRYIIVIKSKLTHFKTVIPLMIFSQILVAGLTLLIKFQTFPLIIVVIPFLIIGVTMVGFYLWFFILLSKTEKTELRALSFLHYYGIALLLYVIFRIIIALTIKVENKTLSSIFQLIEAIPYVFLIFFFAKHIQNSGESIENTINDLQIQ